MTDKPERIQITLYLMPDQIEGLDDLERRIGIGRQASIRRAIHEFLLSQSSTYRTKQHVERPAEPIIGGSK